MTRTKPGRITATEHAVSWPKLPLKRPLNNFTLAANYLSKFTRTHPTRFKHKRVPLLFYVDLNCFKTWYSACLQMLSTKACIRFTHLGPLLLRGPGPVLGVPAEVRQQNSRSTCSVGGQARNVLRQQKDDTGAATWGQKTKKLSRNKSCKQQGI